MKKQAFVDFMSNNGKYLPGMILAGGLWHCGVIICKKLQTEDAANLANGAANLMNQVASFLERVAKTQNKDHQDAEEQTGDPSFHNRLVSTDRLYTISQDSFQSKSSPFVAMTFLYQ